MPARSRFHLPAAPTCVLASLLALPLCAEPLSTSEREKVVERLELLGTQAGQQKAGKVKAAVTAFRQAVQSNDAVMDLYLQCYEKVRYEEQNRPGIEFREWKRQQKDHLTENSFRLALRYQLQWLLLGLEMSEKQLSPAEMCGRVTALLKECEGESPKLGGNLGVLKDNAFHSVFAQAHGISHMAPAKWPASPLPVGPVFDSIILPTLRAAADPVRLESAWSSRLEMETNQLRLEADGKSNEAETRLDKFNTEQRPQLVWSMLNDIFLAGGQRTAAPRMLTFLEANLGDRRAIDWTKEMKALFANDSPGLTGAATE